MTIPQCFHALLHALTSRPESHAVDRLLAELAARSALQLHDAATTRLTLACLRVERPEALVAADRLLRHYGFALSARRHGSHAHVISLTRCPGTPAPQAPARPQLVTEGAHAA